MIAIVDYGAGNMHSIAHALEHVGASVRVTDDPEVVLDAEAVVLPGVGSAGAAMAQTRRFAGRPSAASLFWAFAWACNYWLITTQRAKWMA
jgi:imidazoleglycerol phosphate synthase glutamine amidotransferase subunit HisH